MFTDKHLLFVIDETISIDEDYFVIYVCPILNLFFNEIHKDYDNIYIIKNSQLQKRFYWRLESMCLRYLFTSKLSPVAIDEYNAEFFKNKNIDVVSYIENEQSKAAKIVAHEELKGTKITNLRKLVKEYDAHIDDSKEKMLKKINKYYDELYN